MSNLVASALLATQLCSGAALASPWIEADDAYLRSSVQLLAQGGHLSGHVDTYPLMWNGIAADLSRIELDQLSAAERFAYYRLDSALRFARQPGVNSARLNVASDNDSLRGFAANAREQAGLTVARSFTGDNVAAKLSTTVRYDGYETRDYGFEGSYLAGVLGNWALSLDQVPVWWGPGQDSALALSSYARPIQALRLNRLSDEASSLPGLAALGRWHVTGFFGRSQTDLPYGDHEIGGARATVRPHQRLQLALSYTGQWGGSASAAQAEAWQALELNPGQRNQLLAADARVHLPFGLSAYGEYAQRVGDSRGRFQPVGQEQVEMTFENHAWLIGLETFIPGGERLQHLFVEYADIGAGFYDDRLDPTGYRRFAEPLAARQDQDSQSASLGYRYQTPNGRGWQATLRLQSLNASHPDVVSHYSADNPSQVRRHQVQGEYQLPLGAGLLRLAAQYTYDNIRRHEAGNRSAGDVAVSASLEVRF